MDRRNFLFGLGAAIAAPAIIRPGILMPVKRALLPDGVALTSMAHPAPVAGEQIYLGDAVNFVNGVIRRVTGWDQHIAGVAMASAKPGEAVPLIIRDFGPATYDVHLDRLAAKRMLIDNKMLSSDPRGLRITST